MGIIAWVIFGAIAGWIATRLYGTKEPRGCITNIVIGIVGAWIGGFLGNILFDHDITGFNVSSLILAVGGALVLLFVLNLITKNGK
jgi:uncharacterized membrane protein YeaQ/YmgE (transglycosylase-associated protein family)